MNATYTIEEIEHNGDKRSYLLTVGGKPYQVGELFYLILQGKSDKKTNEEIVDSLNKWASGSYRFTISELEQIIEHKIKPLGVWNPPAVNTTSLAGIGNIRWQKTVFTFEQMRWLLAIVKYAFVPAFFFPVLILALGANYYYMNELIGMGSYAAHKAAVSSDCLRGFSYVVLFYPLITFILFAHELGHAAASYLFGVKPKNIGFGIYYIFPVLFTDVTGIWKLNKTKRVIVNLGGIFIQAIINLGLIYWTYHSGTNPEIIAMITFLLKINVATMIINGLPFMKFDGYWVYSDLFTLPNLRQQSNIYMVRFLNRFFPKLPIRIPEKVLKMVDLKNPFLIIYSIGRYIFMVYFYGRIIVFFFNTISMMPLAARNLINDFSICSAEPFLQASFSLGLFAYFTAVNTKTYRSYFKNRRNA